MEENKRSLRENLPQILKKMKGRKVVVIGDLILDRFIYGSVDRISPEAPVPVVDVRENKSLLGGSANVVRNITALGGSAYPVGVTGDDHEAGELMDMLKKAGAGCTGLVSDPSRPTAVKTRVIALHQQVVRFDRESKAALPDITAAGVRERAMEALEGADAVVISDYGKGVINAALMEELVPCARKRSIPILVDPKPVNLACYKGVSVITPNVKETEAMSGVRVVTDADAERAGRALMKSLGLDSVLVTRSEKGMSLVRKAGESAHITTEARDVFDVTGAGDTAISVFALAMAAGVDLVDAALLANLASGVVVGKLGTAVVTPQELGKAIKNWKR